jgi:hypothetical protein
VNRRSIQLVLAIGVMSLLGAVGVAVATHGGKSVREFLTGYEEVPMSFSTPATGNFTARVDRGSESIEWRLSYRGFETNVTQAHIHFGQRHTTGGVSVWLCGSAAAPGPTGTATCPMRAGTVTGVAERDDVVGPEGQGIAPREWEEFVAALRAGATYANVHSAARPGGEIRAQLYVRGR